MVTETRYMRKDTHTINGVTLRQLKPTQTVTTDIDYVEVAGSDYSEIHWSFDVIKRTAAGAETVIGSKVGDVHRHSVGSGIQSATWACPETALEITDAIRINAYVNIDSGGWQLLDWYDTAKWITEQLGASKLNAATWTIYAHTNWAYFEPPDDVTDAMLYWGRVAYDTRIEGFAWAAGAAYSPKTRSSLPNTMMTMLNSKMLFSACNRFPKLNLRRP